MGYKGIIIGLIGLIGLSSCDSREDWFELNSVTPDLVIDMDGVVDTIGRHDMKKIVVNLKTTSCREDKWGKWNYIFLTDTCNFTVRGLNEGGNYPIEGMFVEFDDFYDIHFDSEYDKEQNILKASIFKQIILAKETRLLISETEGEVINLCNGRIKVYDSFENMQVYTLEINYICDVSPTPVFSARKIGEPYEYLLSLEDSYDKDGKVLKYEFCIDGNIVPYNESDNRFERDMESFEDLEQDSSYYPVWQSGNAAYGGTYVRATSINSVNHSFQSSGEHVVYYRCMDNVGVWSIWYSQTINVE